MQKLVLFILLLSIFFASCSRKKEVETGEFVKQTEVDSVYKLMSDNKFEADWFNGKFKGTYHRPDDNQMFNGQIRIRKDSLIWISITAVMGIEVFRIEIKPDSLTFINRLEKTYITSSTDYLRKRIGVDVDFEMLESVILGNDFPYYQTDVFKLSNRGENYLLSTISRRKIKKHSEDVIANSRILMQNILIDKFTYKINKQTVKVVGDDKTKLRIYYSDFEMVQNQLFPHKMIIKYKEDNKTYIEFDFSNIEIDTKLRFPFKISKKYKQEKIEDRKKVQKNKKLN